MIEPNGEFYQTTEDMAFRDVTVPKGFITDGISYKFRFIGLFVNKFDPRYIKAVIFHDYLTRDGHEDWDKANKVFEELLPEGWVSRRMVNAVKMYRAVIIRS